MGEGEEKKKNTNKIKTPSLVICMQRGKGKKDCG